MPTTAHSEVISIAKNGSDASHPGGQNLAAAKWKAKKNLKEECEEKHKGKIKPKTVWCKKRWDFGGFALVTCGGKCVTNTKSTADELLCSQEEIDFLIEELEFCLGPEPEDDESSSNGFDQSTF